MIAQWFSLIFHFFSSWFFVQKLGLGILGTGYAYAASNLVSFVSLLIITNTIDEINEAVVYPNSESFQKIGEYLELGVPSTAMLCLEWWVYELMMLIVGTIGVNE